MTTPFDFDKTIAELGALATRLEALVRLACDYKGATLEERRTAALTVCELLESSGALAKVEKAKRWALANRVHFERAQKLGAFISAVRGR